MDKRVSIKNIITSVISHVILLFVAIFVRRLLILKIGNEVNGLNSLFTSIIGMLGITELGIGRAITYSMYKPIIENDKKGIAALYGLYKKLYTVIGAVVFVLGIIILPFLPRFISDIDALDENVYLSFFLTLISVGLSYLYAANTSLIEAFKNNYITTGIVTVASLIRYALQICVILVWKSFTIYLVCNILEVLLVWSLTETIVRKKYNEIILIHEKIDQETKKEIIRNSKASFMHRIGTVLVSTIDSVIISAFIGVVILGKYSNYVLIASIIGGTISLFFTPLTSVVGHLYASGDVRETKRWFDRFYSLNYILGVIFFLGYYAVIDETVRVCFGPGLELTRSVAFIITLNQFTAFMRRTTLLFRDASGTFYYDRWKPIGEGLVNLVLSLMFVNIFPEGYKIVGVIVATIITNLLICHIVDPYVVYKHAFGMSVREYYIRNYSYIALFTLSLVLMTYLINVASNLITGMLINGLISIGVSLVTLGIVAIVDKMFRTEVCTIVSKAIEWLRRTATGCEK